MSASLRLPRTPGPLSTVDLTRPTAANSGLRYNSARSAPSWTGRCTERAEGHGLPENLNLWVSRRRLLTRRHLRVRLGRLGRRDAEMGQNPADDRRVFDGGRDAGAPARNEKARREARIRLGRAIVVRRLRPGRLPIGARWSRLRPAMSVQRCFIDILSPDLTATRDFYVELLGFRATFTSDWFVDLAAPDQPLLEIGILREDHDLVPKTAGGGAMLTVVVPDADAVFAAAKARGVEVVEPPRDLFYGQRRVLLRDPAGTLVDGSSQGAPDPAWMARVKQADDGSYHEEPGER